MLNRRNLLIATGASLAAPHWTSAQTSGVPFPTKPIRIIGTSVVGSPADNAVRRITETLSQVLKQPVILDPKPGANGVIAAREVMNAPRDGHTILNANTSYAVNDVLRPGMGPRLLDELLPVTDLSQGPLVLLVHPSVPVTTARELIEYGKAKPDALNYGSGGPGSFLQLTGERVKIATGLQMREVPYKSPGADIADLVPGHIQVGFTVWAAAEQFVTTGRLRALAVASDKRIKVAPELPTFAEAGLTSITATAWTGMFAPAGTPRETVLLLNRAFAYAVTRPDYVEFWTKDGSDVGGKTPEQFAQFIRAEQAVYRQVVAAAKIKVD
jgi:tripartite-type tricarboxylate transporter receptor subunit TctC